MNKKRFWSIAIPITLISLIWLILTPILFSNAQASAERAAAHPGFQAPQFTLQTPEGVPISLSDFQDKTTLIIFWASWCSVCKRVMPSLQSVYDIYQPSGFEILAVNSTFQDSKPSALAYFESQEYTYKLLLDANGDVSKSYQVHALPTSVLIGPDGVILDVVIGSGINEVFLKARLDEILNKNK
jgi:thiol-disulfide isomerase/thioredoxin